MLFDFSIPGTARAWRPINDVVMGGLSQSRLEPVSSGGARFTGTVSLENGGGFASVRADHEPMDLSAYTALRIRALGDGKMYKLVLLDEPKFDGVQFQASFQPAAGVWSDVLLRFGDFRPRFRGSDLPAGRRLNRATLCATGLMISGRQAGPFDLGISCIDAVSL